ncbi:hypothetical protein PF010_g3247 [Phytophthora fragariae]|uniref:Secreted protein n=1 Tax=Phytophthora fragariae TaxID=53985 RepID=A0A6A4E1R4_9STRA|nr:hypothetical protein PF009_g5774 [Phytophthora fragariae]KAE9132234.1 hypothetical protein PF010_g3247 [Phytophthora fragariae]KAE9150744.1 hypothetical protein PF006_g4902 [Phytophthora fragariae]KAE9316477.1 hypothetical protein PF001_g7312 [Phytophthora fragariae]KAE9353560.1 hypothetical protein PF008_g4948 [Phytophthora fragariae]
MTAGESLFTLVRAIHLLTLVVVQTYRHPPSARSAGSLRGMRRTSPCASAGSSARAPRARSADSPRGTRPTSHRGTEARSPYRQRRWLRRCHGCGRVVSSPTRWWWRP